MEIQDNSIIPIILLNWNGWKDTIDCIKSLFQSTYTNFCIIIADNDSSDNSVEKIVAWLYENQIKSQIYLEDEKILSLEKSKVYLYEFQSNYGFAKANNKLISNINDLTYNHALLLNNDTEVEKDFLHQLISFAKTYPQYKALTPLICYYSQKDKIWNAGGKLFLGLRKYYYTGKSIYQIKHKEKIEISFITGCALLFNKEVLERDPLFTEKFFFGEEDFDFSMRMKKQKLKMACVLDAKIYHKVSSSTKTIANLNKIYLYYLNRFVNIKLNTSPILYFIWKHLYLVYIYFLLLKTKFTMHESLFFIKKLYQDSGVYDEVNKRTFNLVLDEQYLTPHPQKKIKIKNKKKK